MSALVPTNIQLPAHLAERVGVPSTIASDMVSGIGGGGFKRVSIRGGRFRIREGSNEIVLPGTTLRAVIVGASPGMTKSFYKKYDAKAEDKKPDCYSNDGIRPASDAEDPQSQLCATCEQNQWGSKTVDDKKMKACADQKRLAIISADDRSDEPEVYLFTVTPAALRDFSNYGNLLASKGLPPELVITELSFDTDASFPKIEFKFGGFVEKEMVPVIDNLLDSSLVNEITGRKPTTATSEVVAKPKPSPIKEVEPEVEVVVPEIIIPPKATKGFSAPAAPSTVIKTEAPAAPPVVQSTKLNDDILDIINKMKNEEDDDNDDDA